MRDLMKAEGFATWPKLTGGKGIHLMAPLDHAVSHDEAHQSARRLVSALGARFPDDILSAQARRRGASSSTICAMAAALPRSGPIRRAPAKDFQSPRRSPAPYRSRHKARCLHDQESIPRLR
jgi:hypothetical protein